MRSYSPEEFVTRLSASELPDPAEVTIFGLVKTEADSASVIHFSSSPSCEDWLMVPTEIIESVEHLKTMACKDHQHPLVKIKFKQPEEGRQDMAFLLGMLSRTQHALARAVRDPRDRNDNRGSGQGCTEDCKIINTGEGLTICCWCPDNELVCTGIV